MISRPGRHNGGRTAGRQKNCNAMITLSTPTEVAASAFSAAEYIPEEAITEADIAAAERHSIIPVTGRALYERLAAGGYPTLCEEFVKPALAASVRVAVQPLLAVRCGACGIVTPRSDSIEPADAKQRGEVMRALRRRASELLRRLSEELERSAAAYPEYDSRDNILNRCTIYGDIVQTH